MALTKRYDHRITEPDLQAQWQQERTYEFGGPTDSSPVFSIDTPPPTVSGALHLGHAFSYSHPDFIARYKRMTGHNVYYPIGFDDNGLPTEHLVERTDRTPAHTTDREAFTARCRALSTKVERDYERTLRRLGLSVDWRHSYRTIDPQAVRTAQHAFLQLLDQGIVYRREAPTIWCTGCGTAIAQAELEDVDRGTTFYTLPFAVGEDTISIQTTRPELLHACVALLVHPGDERWHDKIGARATVPLFGHDVPVIADEGADPTKGSGAVMCCTFGDQSDVTWWRTHGLPLRPALDASGNLYGDTSGPYRGLSTSDARERIVAVLDTAGQILGRRAAEQTVRVHDRCDTPAEFVVTQQWFVRLLDERERLLEAAAELNWHPPHMGARLIDWIENLKWDWCISRQRSHGVPFPVWSCEACGTLVPAALDDLPVDPRTDAPRGACRCGGAYIAETDVMDTWATSSLTPQIAGRMLDEPELFARVFPYSMRPQAHEIIRTWTFYTLAQSMFHEGTAPWKHVFISGWGILPDGRGKISKSRGGAAQRLNQVFDRYGADAVRYWAASTGPGKDALVDEDKIQAGRRLVTKLWNVGRFAERFLEDTTHRPDGGATDHPSHTSAQSPSGDRPPNAPVDRWLLARAQATAASATEYMDSYDYAGAKAAAEAFFWHDLADNYLELAKSRLYDAGHPQHYGACEALRSALLTTLKVLAPFLPYVTETLYRGLYAKNTTDSIHASSWPTCDEHAAHGDDEAFGETIVSIATAVRRYKSERSMSLGAELACLQVTTGDAETRALLRACKTDLRSVTRARTVLISDDEEPGEDHPHGTTVLADGLLTAEVVSLPEGAP